jgi:hypothetical protein
VHVYFRAQTLLVLIVQANEQHQQAVNAFRYDSMLGGGRINHNSKKLNTSAQKYVKKQRSAEPGSPISLSAMSRLSRESRHNFSFSGRNRSQRQRRKTSSHTRKVSRSKRLGKFKSSSTASAAHLSSMRARAQTSEGSASDTHLKPLSPNSKSNIFRVESSSISYLNLDSIPDIASSDNGLECSRKF